MGVSFSNYESKHESLLKFRSDLLNCLGDEVFLPSQISLCFHLIKCIEYPFFNEARVYEEEEIQQGCEDVKQQFISKFNLWEEQMLNKKSPSVFDLFIYNLLGFERLPENELRFLEKQVMEDLKKRNQTIQFYSSLPYIKTFKADGSKPRDQKEKTQHTFYIRNIDEQQKIINYLLHGIKQRALTRAKSYDSFSVPFVLNTYYDRPYFTAISGWEKYFDDSKIDTVGHRLEPIRHLDSKELVELYNHGDKEVFYKKLQEKFSFGQAIHYIDYYLKQLQPLKQSRIDLFSELFELFRSEKWYGFYGLALSQVEGLFSEMLSIVESTTPSKGSLPEKVRTLRSSYRYSGGSFDYYEFYIPHQRNKFMHSGIDEDLKIKSYGLLYDLVHILSVYISLDSPIIQLTQLIKRKDSYINEEDFNEYFKLVERCKNSFNDHPSIKEENEKYERDYLSLYTHLETVVNELVNDVPIHLLNLTDVIKLYTENNNKNEFNFGYWKISKIKAEAEKLVQDLSGVWGTHEQAFLKADGYRYFLEHFEEHLPNIPIKSKEKLKKLKVMHMYKIKSDQINLNQVQSIIEAFRSQQEITS